MEERVSSPSREKRSPLVTREYSRDFNEFRWEDQTAREGGEREGQVSSREEESKKTDKNGNYDIKGSLG